LTFLLVAGKFDPELVLLGLGISFFNLNARKIDDLSFAILLLGVVQLLFLALEREIPLNDLLTEETFAVLLPYIPAGGLKFLLLLLGLSGFLRRFRLFILRFLITCNGFRWLNWRFRGARIAVCVTRSRGSRSGGS